MMEGGLGTIVMGHQRRHTMAGARGTATTGSVLIPTMGEILGIITMVLLPIPMTGEILGITVTVRAHTPTIAETAGTIPLSNEDCTITPLRVQRHCPQISYLCEGVMMRSVMGFGHLTEMLCHRSQMPMPGLLLSCQF